MRKVKVMILINKVLDGGEMDFGGLEVNFKEFTESFLISLKNKKGGISWLYY